MLTKQKLRSKILHKLKTQKEENREEKSAKIKQKLFKTSVFRRSKKIMFYISFDGEVDTKEMIKEAKKIGKIIAVPVSFFSKVIKPCILGAKPSLKRGLYGVREPAIKKMIDKNELDLIIVPGLAFDKKGNRLGRGKGYYDSFLSCLPKHAKSIGLAFDFQILPSIPTTKRDIRVNKVIFA
ncbi:MAG: 5-formyltetrahydrofolate cyclo-ligase [Candidatus Omnitrophota bacterium]|jgi:5-formyltetrahydrofolate cyclo-ligase|nr:MAG: 5-formyltetrahydrofolate cyclo-ligase [Candidatus Omnitrophota bacterium]